MTEQLKKLLLTIPKGTQAAIGEGLAISCGYDEDYYEGWNMPTFGFFELATIEDEKVIKVLDKLGIATFQDAEGNIQLL